MFLDIAYILAGILAHQTRRPMEMYPGMFPVGWREIACYVIGTLCIHKLLTPMGKRYGLTNEQCLIMKHTHLTTAVLLGVGTTLGWMFDGFVTKQGIVLSRLIVNLKHGE